MKTPVTIISGFLGSGKTTFINKIVEENKDQKFGLILNEFGDINLESEFIQKKDIDIKEFPSGCMCHVPQGDIARAVHEILNLENKVDHIIIEASGLTDPFFVAMTIATDELSNLVYVNSVIAVIDSLNYKENSKKRIFFSQLETADVVIISKLDEVDEKEENELHDFLKKHSKTKLFIPINDENAPKIMFEEINYSLFKNTKEKKELDDHHDYKKFLLKLDEPIDKYKFYDLLENMPQGIIRIKGYFSWGYEKDMRYFINGVGPRINKSKSVNKESKALAMLFIGNDFDEKRLEEAVKECIWVEPKGILGKAAYFTKVILNS